MRILRSRKLGGGLTVLAVTLSSLHVASAEPIPQGRRIAWTSTGVPGGIPARTNVCATFNPGATASAINTAISSCSSSGGGVVMLNAGTYSLNGINLVSSNVTLRGAGADRTILRGGNIIDMGNGSNTNINRPLTGGGAKDATTFTVGSTSGLAVNQMIELDRPDDPTFVVSTSGGSRFVSQMNRITAINGTTITVQNPLFWDFSTGRIIYTFTGISLSGIEDLKLDHSLSSGASFMWQYCYACWLKGVESYKPDGYHLIMLGTLNSEIRNSYIHEAQTFGSNNGGLAIYGNFSYGTNSSFKFENNVFDRTFPAIELQNSSSGGAMLYNYSYGSAASATNEPVTWTFDDNHGPHDMMNLWEGNIGELFGADGYFGSSSHGTLFRSFITGMHPRSGDKDAPIRLKRLSYHYNLVGNVLGAATLNPAIYSQNTNNCSAGVAIYEFGYPNIGNCSWSDVTGNPVPGGMTYPDARVASTILRWGNYDDFNLATQWRTNEIPSGVPVPGDQVLANSYYYSVRPAWFPLTVAWPPIGPDVTGGNGDGSGHVNKIPAQLCWESRNLVGGGSFSASACYPRDYIALPPPPGAPTNLRIQ